MTATYDAIATTTLTSTQDVVTFTSLPSNFTDIFYVVRNASGGVNLRIRVNSDTGSNYSATQLYGDGSSAASLRNTNTTYALGGTIGNNGVATGSFMNYANTTTNKTIISRGGSGGATYLDMAVSLWRSTAAINSISFSQEFNGVTLFAAGSTFTLYGIKTE
jgi:hypothetical protein